MEYTSAPSTFTTSTTTTVTMTVTRQLTKTAARVFGQLEGGGNPVTIFTSSVSLQPATRVTLAQSCAWESVVVDRTRRSMAFYLPTGEPVDFCAHAAMGGVTQLLAPSAGSDASQSVSFTTDHADDTTRYTAHLHDHNIVALDLRTVYEEAPVPHPPTVRRILREAFGLRAGDLTQPPARQSADAKPPYPTLRNASVARPKTLVYVNSLETLHAVKVPPVTNHHFRVACDAIGSTGVYLYAFDAADDTWACRQFPRASGYPEDPATGVAAAALAVALHKAGHVRDAYKCTQGTAMGQGSVLLVEDIQRRDADNHVSLRILGRVETDESEVMEIEEPE
jgi:predicted PhzF superfamily epimerase YddE/YHI9